MPRVANMASPLRSKRITGNSRNTKRRRRQRMHSFTSSTICNTRFPQSHCKFVLRYHSPILIFICNQKYFFFYLTRAVLNSILLGNFYARAKPYSFTSLRFASWTVCCPLTTTTSHCRNSFIFFFFCALLLICLFVAAFRHAYLWWRIHNQATNSLTMHNETATKKNDPEAQ